MSTVLSLSPRADTAAACRAGLAIDRLINAWLRERLTDFTPVQGDECIIDIGEARLRAHCLHMSPGGFHRWRLPVAIEDGDGASRRTNTPVPLAALMAEAMARDGDASVQAMRRRLADAVEQAERHGLVSASRPADMSPIGLEQALWHGHPFHPFAKSIEGFSADDVERFAPERGKCFQLRWIIAEPDVGTAAWRDGPTEKRMRTLLANLSGLSERIIGERILIPAHPWQAERLANAPVFAQLAAQGRVLLTLPSGMSMQPTSSVRTVFAPGADIFLKLPIEARITNFARTNPREHLARSMAASRALGAVRDHIAACGFDMLDEPAAMWIDHPELDAMTGVILREAPAREAFVLAGLLEPSARDGRPMLEVMGCDLSAPSDGGNWLSAYVQKVILPPLRLFARTGISVEAHGQNSLLALEKHHPVRLIVRDLEGISIDRARFLQVAPALDLDPCVCWPSEGARERLFYYLVSNHLNHVIATVARMAGIPETELWQYASDMLTAAQEDEETSRLIASLLSSATLPAKANFTSCFSGRGERPDYVHIANPLHACAQNHTERSPRVAIIP